MTLRDSHQAVLPGRELFFEDWKVFSDTQHLRDTFLTDSLTLDVGAELNLRGKIRLGSQVVFRGLNRLDAGSVVDNFCTLINCTFGEKNYVRPNSILEGVAVGQENVLGPNCFIRSGSVIGDNCIIGAGVEVAKSKISNNVKISHYCYVGDAMIGNNTVIGAGVIFCNWRDGKHFISDVGAEVLIGSGSNLVAPIHIGEGAVIGAGTTITKDVPKNSKIIQKK